jgi:arabinogalactan endo-1,4-beta-galactosidase
LGLLWHCSSEQPAAPAPTRDEPSQLSPAPQPPLDPPPPGGEGEEISVAPTGPNQEGNPMLGSLEPSMPEPPPSTPEAMPPIAMPPTTPPPPPGFTGSFILGADISSLQEAIEGGSRFVDTDGAQKTIFELLENHGFNYVRLRTFVNPAAAYGYASGNGCQAKAEPYNDRDHTIEFAREVKAAGMGLLLDLHYSDTWADPGKQVIPEAWRGLQSVAALAEQVQAYTVDVLGALVAANARPDMVQVGNEITPGLLIHVPTANTNCYGNNSATNQGVNGSANNWDNTATLLRAGIAGVRQVDSSIQVMLHIENFESANGVLGWVRNAQMRGVEFDVLGLSAYEAFQGPSSAWRATLQTLATQLPGLDFAIAEYNPQRRLLNDLMREMPERRGLGTFFWEPTQSGEWGQAMFDWQGNTATARAADFAAYDQMRTDFGL